MQENYVIIHGSFGSPFDNWFPWLARELKAQNKSALVPDFPIGADLQTYDNWKNLLKYYCDLGYINETTTLIGHSIASIFIVKFLIESKIKVKKIILVAGFNNYSGPIPEIDYVNKTFFTNNISKIKNYCKEIVCAYSENDPYITIEVLEQFAQEISTKTIVIPEGGHFNTDSDYNEFNEILEEV